MFVKQLAVVVFSLFLSAPAFAHFGMIIPDTATVMDKKNADLTLDIAFAHPFEGRGMKMERPRAFGVTCEGKTTDLLAGLRETKFMDNKAWTGKYAIKRPGVYIFSVTPEPYFEPAEDSFIIHYAKTVVAAYGAEDGWDARLGLPVEIVPLTRPFGLYAGNVFQGVALKNGKPLAGATVEIECLNQKPRHEAPNDYFVTQSVLTDANGVFTVGIPWAGWWGFAALTGADSQLEMQGRKKDVELGGILWVRFVNPVPEK